LNETLLELKSIVKQFGGLVALKDVSFSIQRGDLLGLIGPNGAGKSVAVNVITGLYKPTEGSVLYRNQDITKLRPDQIVRKGISRTFQNSTLFFEMTVMENIMMGIRTTSEINLLEAIFKTRSNQKKDRIIKQRAEEIIDLLHIGRHAQEEAGQLPYGLQKVVSIGIALASNPELLILDEPLTGLIASEVDEVMSLIRGLHEKGLTVMLIEHNVRAVMSNCHRIVVLSVGEKIAEGVPREIQQNEQVIKSYLGGA